MAGQVPGHSARPVSAHENGAGAHCWRLIHHLSSKVRRRGRAGGVIDIAARSGTEATHERRRQLARAVRRRAREDSTGPRDPH